MIVSLVLITAVSAAILPWIISIDYVYVLIIGLMLLTAIINLSITFYRVRISVLVSLAKHYCIDIFVLYYRNSDFSSSLTRKSCC